MDLNAVCIQLSEKLMTCKKTRCDVRVWEYVYFINFVSAHTSVYIQQGNVSALVPVRHVGLGAKFPH